MKGSFVVVQRRKASNPFHLTSMKICVEIAEWKRLPRWLCTKLVWN